MFITARYVAVAHLGCKKEEIASVTSVSTRKLILAALACGIAILIAGTLWLVLENSDRATVSSAVVKVGVSQSLGDVNVSVKSVSVVEGQYHAVVAVASGAQAVDTAKGWGLVVTVKGPTTVPVVDPAGLSDLDFQACAGQKLVPNASVSCVVAFGPVPAGGDIGEVFVSYLHANVRSTWQVSITK